MQPENQNQANQPSSGPEPLIQSNDPEVGQPPQQFGAQPNQPTTPPVQQGQANPYVSQPQSTPPQQASQTDTLGIVSLALTIFFPLAGAIVGFIGMSKAKNEGYPGTLSKVGAIINTVLVVLGILFFALFFMIGVQQGIQEAASDSLEQAPQRASTENDSLATPGPQGEGAPVSAQAGDYEVEFSFDLSRICNGDGWPTNIRTSESGNILYGMQKDNFGSDYSLASAFVEGYESLSFDDPATVDKLFCATNIGNEVTETIQCKFSLNDEEVDVPVDIRDYTVTLLDVATQQTVSTFTVSGSTSCPFVASIGEENRIDADMDSQALTAALQNNL
jgi:large-conductance mechanosensitive channel